LLVDTSATTSTVSPIKRASTSVLYLKPMLSYAILPAQRDKNKDDNLNMRRNNKVASIGNVPPQVNLSRQWLKFARQAREGGYQSFSSNASHFNFSPDPQRS
jgi:hypothetical protein